ncbi:hypothetical protein CBR_g12368 [Chara braunii]|uniref:Uncharacterized protein n=1 Tax=Chara braunii TaxID=69332 RepID=A0A388KRV7_CHABU|nr:hypothetical protein CBR_g12368 [Chara braunii]|eukprot:GBG72800.1 hypothetical protein CBR_g12368 [Chara braunii]
MLVYDSTVSALFVEFDTMVVQCPAAVVACSCLMLFSISMVFAHLQGNDCVRTCAFSFSCDYPLKMDREGKPSKRRASRSSGSMEESPKKTKGTPTDGMGTEETPRSKGQRTPVLRGAPSMGTPSTRVRGSGPDMAMLMSGRPAGQEEVTGGRQGKSAVDVVPRRKRSGEMSVAGVGDKVSVINHKNKFWMLDWVGEIGEPSSGLVLYVVIKDNIVPIGGVVKWSGRGTLLAMLELTMVLNAKGQEPVAHAEDRISKPKSVLSSSLEAAPSSRPLTIGVHPPRSLRTLIAAMRVPKSGQIGEKGPCRGQIMWSAPVKSRTTSTKEPFSVVRPMRCDFAVPSRAEGGPQYFGDDDEENNEEDSERDGEREEYEEGGDEKGKREEEQEGESG